MNATSDEPEPQIVPGRSCESCTMCCKVFSIAALEKPAQTWCVNCDIGKGCRIYADRPGECRQFFCGWLLDARISDAWRPRDCRIVVKFEPKRIVVHVDKDRKTLWRKEPYHSQIRAWARAGLAYEGEVIVFEGLEGYRILPDRELKLAGAKP